MAPPTPDLAEVVARLERAEREILAEQRRNRWLLAAVGLAAVGLVLAWTLVNTTTTAQAQGAKVLRANQYIVEDENGKTRAALIASKDGPGLVIRDENGKNRIGLVATTDGPALALADHKGTNRIGVAVTPVGPALKMFDQNGKDRATLGVMDKGGSWLEMLDRNGKTIWSRP